MPEPRAFVLQEPQRLTSAAVFSSPHSGRDYPAALTGRSRLDPLALRASEDAYVDLLLAHAPEAGAPLLAASAPRAFVDLNRGPEELDPALVRGVRATGLNPRVAAGLGVVPRIVAEGRAIYDGKLSLAEARRRVARHHAPYHRALASVMARAETRFGFALLFDCHSMPSDALRAAAKVKGARPEIVLGDRFGTSAARRMIEATTAAFEASGFVVARNAPFAGGHITQRYGRPSQGWHAIQIEIDRGLYLDEAKVEPGTGFDGVRRALTQVIRALAEIGDLSALAAE